MSAPAMEALRSADEIRDVNTRYHDAAASSYDSKWGIDFGPVGQGQVLGKLRKLLGPELDRGFGRSLEIGAGHGVFQPEPAAGGGRARGDVHRHLAGDDPHAVGAMRSGWASRSVRPARTPSRCHSPTRASTSCSATRCCTISPTCAARSTSFTACCGPADGSRSPASRRGWATASPRSPSARAVALAPAWRTLLGAAPAAPGSHNGRSDDHDHSLEPFVDIHAFTAGDLSRHAHRAGFDDVSVRGEELVANWFGWFNRSLEASAEPADVPMLWRRYAFNGYLLLQRVDTHVLETRLPPAIFYNLLLSARKP